MIALGEVLPNCEQRKALIGDTFNLPAMLKSLRSVGFDASRPAVFLIEDVVEYMLPELASEMFAYLAQVIHIHSSLFITITQISRNTFIEDRAP